MNAYFFGEIVLIPEPIVVSYPQEVKHNNSIRKKCFFDHSRKIFTDSGFLVFLGSPA